MSEQNKATVAIILDEMSVGGIPKACISYIKQLSKNCDVTMILCNDKGELHDMIPQVVQVKISPYGGTSSAFKHQVKNNRFGRLIDLGIKYLRYAYIEKRWVKATVLLNQNKAQLVNDEFDCAIAYHGMNISQLTRTLYQVNAKKKVAWIHGDHPFTGKHRKDVVEVYESFDKIYCDSLICKNNFLRDFPTVQDKTEVSHCLMGIEEIRKKSVEQMDVDFASSCFNILTVGRISPEKGQDMIPDTITRLREKGYNIKWYLVGDGPDRVRIEQMADEKECKELVFLGVKTNPYPYMKQCDIYVQPSYSEAYSLTAFEAATLEKVVVLTDVAGATEILRDGEDAIVVEPNEKSIAEGIEKVILDKELRIKIAENLSGRDFSNREEVNKLLSWIKK